MQRLASVRSCAGPARSILRALAGAPRAMALRILLAVPLLSLLLASGASAAPGAAEAAPSAEGVSATLATGGIRGDSSPQLGSALEVGAWFLVGVVVLVWLASDWASMGRRRRR
jgi:hypothetical protein